MSHSDLINIAAVPSTRTPPQTASSATSLPLLSHTGQIFTGVSADTPGWASAPNAAPLPP